MSIETLGFVLLGVPLTGCVGALLNGAKKLYKNPALYAAGALYILFLCSLYLSTLT